MAGPFVAGSVRLLVAAGLGWVAVTDFHVGLGGLFALVALASVLFGVFTALATWTQVVGFHGQMTPRDARRNDLPRTVAPSPTTDPGPG